MCDSDALVRTETPAFFLPLLRETRTDEEADPPLAVEADAADLLPKGKLSLSSSGSESELGS
jgi:hypothetical protein